MQYCSSNASGTVGSYTYTIGRDAAFKATWNNSGDFLARVGLQWNETRTYDQLGTISADFAYTRTGSGGGYSFIGIYGWLNSPLVEYYIVEDWYGSGPPTGGGALKGTFTVDGVRTKSIRTRKQISRQFMGRRLSLTSSVSRRRLVSASTYRSPSTSSNGPAMA